MHGSNHNVVLRTSEDEVFTSNDPEALIQEHLGWRVPVAGLRFWAVGLYDPATPRVMQLDERGRISQLQQGGWDVDFRRYTLVNELELPDKIFLSNHELDVRLVIDRWELDPEAVAFRQPAS
jgi:outer membrane lipoprotein LolB